MLTAMETIMSNSDSSDREGRKKDIALLRTLVHIPLFGVIGAEVKWKLQCPHCIYFQQPCSNRCNPKKTQKYSAQLND